MRAFSLLSPIKPMRSPRFAFFRAHSILAAVLLGGLAMSVRAEAPKKSLLPAFGNEGAEFTIKGQSGHETKGWLPTDWKDNSEWAAVDATYTKLTDSPDKDAGAVGSRSPKWMKDSFNSRPTAEFKSTKREATTS
jgi:hypothetical protein